MFKLGRAPFHIWITDIYEGTKTINLPIIILIPKIAIIRTLITFETQHNILLICGILSTTIGAIGAINQKKIKRLLAYSRINNTGIILIGIYVYTLPRIQASIIHTIIYRITTRLIIIILTHTNNMKYLIRETFQNDKTNRLHNTTIAILLLSLSGLPPFPGFLRKWLIISSIIKQKFIIIATWILLTNIPATAYYLYTIIYRYFKTLKRNRKNINILYIKKHKYKIAILTYPTIRLLAHPHTILIPSWIASTTTINVHYNNKSSSNKIHNNS